MLMMVLTILESLGPTARRKGSDWHRQKIEPARNYRMPVSWRFSRSTCTSLLSLSDGSQDDEQVFGWCWRNPLI